MMRALLILGAALAIVFAPAAEARKRAEIHPYLEVDQTVFADLKDGGPAQSYTSVAAGIQANVSTPRAELALDYRYEHRFAWDGNQGDADIHSGLLRGAFRIAPDFLQIDAGALATRARTDIRGDAANPFIGNPRNISQLFSVYAGPTLATRAGPFDIGALYRFGYTKVDTQTRGVFAPGAAVIGAFDDSTSHVASAYLGMGTGTLPFAWRMSANYEREDASQLDQRFESKNVRVDVTMPVAPTVALVGGAGYEKIEASQRDAVRDVNGDPVLDSNGRFITDPASPRLLTFDSDGFIWDVGVLWKPSRRTSLEARIGRRYGGTIYTGSFSYQPSEDIAVQVGVYDGIQTFGRQVNSAIAALPTQFTLARNPFGGGIGGCVYGSGGSGAGGCLDAILQSLANGTYRSRGVAGVARYAHGPWNAGIGLGYAERRFFAPNGSVLAVANGITDKIWYAQGYVGRRIDDRSVLDASVYVDWFDPGLPNAADVLGTGATASYSRTFGRRLQGTASLGLYSTRIEDLDSSLVGAAQLGARYTF